MKYFILLLLTFTYALNLYAEQCLINVAAFDIGSGTTKMKVGEIDICKNKIVNILYKESQPVGYKESTYLDKKTKRMKFSSEVMNNGLKALKDLKAKAQKFRPNNWVGVATSAFRSATNSKSFLKRVKKELGIDISVISQVEEGELGFLGAIANYNSKEKPIVWDIGGGSTQIITKIGDDTLFYGGEMGAVSFKKRVIKEIKKSDPLKVKSPNPLGNRGFSRAVKMASKFARNFVSKKLTKLIKSHKVIGIGGVHNFSILGQLKSTGSYTISTLERVALSRSRLKDSDIKGKYYDTEITNLAFVLGFMKELKITRVDTLKVDLTDGLLANPYFLKSD